MNRDMCAGVCASVYVKRIENEEREVFTEHPFQDTSVPLEQPGQRPNSYT